MQIREIEPRDNQAIKRVIKDALEREGLNLPGTAYFDPQINDLAGHYKPLEKSNYWVLVNNDDTVAGGIGISSFNAVEGICELEKLYIAEPYLGKGYSKLLMDVALQFAKKHYRKCYLETMAQLSVANQLYVSYGFEKLKKPLAETEHHTMDTWFLKRL